MTLTANAPSATVLSNYIGGEFVASTSSERLPVV